MNTTRLADLLNIDPVTLRRWTAEFKPFLSPTATPEKGKNRTLSVNDVRVLYYVANMRSNSYSLDEITERLQDMQKSGWEGLPDLPSQWGEGETVAVEVAASRASELAQVAVLQTELAHTRQALEVANSQIMDLQQQLQVAQQKERELRVAIEAEKEATRSAHDSSKDRIHVLEVELANTSANVRELQARLQSYSLGREKPLSIAVIALGALLVGAVLVIIAIIVGALLG